MAGTKQPQRFEPSGGYRPLPSGPSQQKAARARNLKVGLWSVGAIALVVFSMTWNPPTERTHSFTKASDYVASKESGCTNSGEGCHDSESSYSDYNVYHPNTNCTTCHEYQGVGCIPCHSPKGGECQSCHDGTMPGAGDQVRLTDPYPKGHYRETTHTATGTDMKAVMRAAKDGEAQAKCTECHSRDLRKAHEKVPPVEGSEYGESVGCGECHNDTRSFGLEQVLANWEDRRCESCHREDSSSPMHSVDVAAAVESTGGPGCGETGAGCHDDSDVHSLHANAPENCSGSAKDGEPGCHDLEREAHQPEMTTCGGGDQVCHPKYENDRFTHDEDRKVHSVKGTLAANRRFGDTPCGACHVMLSDRTSLVTEHERPGNALAGAKPNTCEGCHNSTDATVEAVKNDWPARDTASACESCHDGATVTARHSEIQSAHRGNPISENGRPAPDACSGGGCHDTIDLLTLHRKTGCTTAGCHDTTGNIRGTTKSCGGTDTSAACHASVHDGDDALHTAGIRQAAASLTDTATGIVIACYRCHSMKLRTEHIRPGSSIASGTSTVCARCHDASSAAGIVSDGWSTRPTAQGCAACHTTSTINARHTTLESKHVGRPLTDKNEPSEKACVDGGCHAVLDLRILHVSTGCTTKGCHGSEGDIRGANIKSCGGTDTAVACHVKVHDGDDALHTAGRLQAEATMTDPATGVVVRCTSCHGMKLRTEHVRPNASIATGAGTVCARCHDFSPVTRAVAREDWEARDTASACAACHGAPGGSSTPHSNIATAHVATEHSLLGTPTPGTCVTAGCHGSTDVRVLHARKGCTNIACHRATDDIRGILAKPSCGRGGCHPTVLSATTHRPAHAADLDGTIEGVTYRVGENIGCFGCHYRDLQLEHSRALQAGMEGGGASTCRICHEGPTASENGTFSALPAVKNAIAAGDRRCVACHRSGSATDGPIAVASPHRGFPTDGSSPPGRVWADPADEWRVALDSDTGGGHNVLSAEVVGLPASKNKNFPMTNFTIEGTAYTWASIPNTGTTRWLRNGTITTTETVNAGVPTREFPGAISTETIRPIMITCDDCHVLNDPTGPQGASVPISIDPAYSQTEYASPTAGRFQFDPFNLDSVNRANGANPPGYKPVVCVKCHLVYARSRENTIAVTVGGHGMHNTHRSRFLMPALGRTEACIDCHVRIPHAWKRPRLLLRTVEAEGIEPDKPPYAVVDNKGLVGMRLRSFSAPAQLTRESCVTGGCYEAPGRSSTTTNHPLPAQLPGQKYWP